MKCESLSSQKCGTGWAQVLRLTVLAGFLTFVLPDVLASANVTTATSGLMGMIDLEKDQNLPEN
ncbi:MAG: hypothetical protein JNM57_02535 [Cyclobacteriaceae bacterium]|nr:hypothetical protein [Cyclobacteriaceae bacterium]